MEESAISAFSAAQSSKDIRLSNQWILYVFRRFFFPRSGGNRSLMYLAVLGVSMGVFAIICVIAVMNGLQQSYMDSLLEISSYHIQIGARGEEELEAVSSYAQDHVEEVRSILPFHDLQVLVSGLFSSTHPFRLRALPVDAVARDNNLLQYIRMVEGSFNLRDGIVLSRNLAYATGIFVGETIDIMSFPQNPAIPLSSVKVVVTGLFESDVSDSNGNGGYVSLQQAERMVGKNLPRLGIKLKNRNRDNKVAALLHKSFPDVEITSWRQLNWSIFGALRVEKLTIVFLLGIIFIVVGSNVFHSFRRNVIKRSRDIAILCFLGGTQRQIRSIFIFAGLATGICGSVIGLLLGLAVTMNIETVIFAVESMLVFLQENISMFGNDAQAVPAMYWYLDMNAHLSYLDVFLIIFFAISSIFLAAYRAVNSVQLQQKVIARMV